jgi:hypothetical protein
MFNLWIVPLRGLEGCLYGRKIKLNNWRKNKPSGAPKHIFDDAVPFNQRKNKVKYAQGKNKRRRK